MTFTYFKVEFKGKSVLDEELSVDRLSQSILSGLRRDLIKGKGKVDKNQLINILNDKFWFVNCLLKNALFG